MDGAACRVWDHSQCEGTAHCPPRCPRFVDSEGVPLLVHPYRSEQFDALREMYEEIDAYSRTLGVPPASERRRDEWLEHLTENGRNIVAVHGDRVVGHICAVPTDANDPEFVVFVHQDYQDRGIGTELVKHLIADAENRDCDALTLSVATGNRRAISVYDNLGFDVSERLEAELRMELSLEDPVVRRVQRPPAER